MDKFACDFILTKNEDVLECEDHTIMSSIPDLHSYIDFEYDCFESFKGDRSKEIKELPNGDYDVFGYGNVWCETSRDWETGIVDDVQWMFEFEFVSINKNTWLEEQRKIDEKLKGTDISRAESVDKKDDWN